MIILPLLADMKAISVIRTNPEISPVVSHDHGNPGKHMKAWISQIAEGVLKILA
jgi:hypothetical protein